MVNLKLKQMHPKALPPTVATSGSGGMDFRAVTKENVSVPHANLEYVEYRLGWALEIPPGYVGLLLPRSSSSNTRMALANHVGLIDSDYRGEITARFRILANQPGREYEVGDKIIQLVIVAVPTVSVEVVSELSDTERGSNGYGSSGK